MKGCVLFCVDFDFESYFALQRMCVIFALLLVLVLFLGSVQAQPCNFRCDNSKRPYARDGLTAGWNAVQSLNFDHLRA
jgi:hypothetical protein